MDKVNKEHKDETVFQQIVGLEMIGGYITLFIGLIPSVAIIGIKVMVTGSDVKPGILLIEVCCIATLFWLLFLEKYGKVTVTIPHLPIPVKWIIPFVMVLTPFGIFN